MKKWWEVLSLRIDNLSLRERGLLFASLIVFSFVVVNGLWLSPAAVAPAQLKQRLVAQDAELQMLRAKLQDSAKPVDVNAGMRQSIADVEAELTRLGHDIQALATAPDQGSGLERVLVQFLRREEGLTLLAVNTLQPEAAMKTDVNISAATAILQAATAASAPSPAKTEPSNEGLVKNIAVSAVQRRGLELKVMGPYAALLRYVKTLETALPNLRWGAMQLKSSKTATELTLQVFVVEVQS